METLNIPERISLLNNISDKSGFNFKFITNFDISEIKKHIDLKNITQNKWQKYLNLGWHQNWDKGVETNDLHFLMLINTDRLGDLKNPIFTYMSPKNLELLSIITPIIRRLEQEFGDQGKVLRAYFARVLPGETLHEHRDQDNNDNSETYQKLIHKYHIPITTNDKVWTQVNGERLHMEPGECWELNNNLLHNGANEGNTDRIHLTIEISPYRWL